MLENTFTASLMREIAKSRGASPQIRTLHRFGTGGFSKISTIICRFAIFVLNLCNVQLSREFPGNKPFREK